MLKTQLNRLLLAFVIANLCFVVGCHRSYYRRQADAEAKRLISEKAVDPRWDSADGSIDIDPQSRMFNPFSQDHPPIPPDDAASHQFMHRVDGKEGYPHWHANGDTDAVENPDWKAYLPVNEKGQVVLTLERAYQLALLHSPDLQQQNETLYRSALAVSLERFGFDSQLFSGFNTFVNTQGRFRGGGTSRTTVQSQIGANGGGANLRRVGITGTNFAVGLANTILFNLAGNNTQSATSLIDFSLVQPLLRGAGRERIMESLTQSERTLLANVRQIERFRRGFYLNVAIGRNPGAGPNLGGNFLNAPGGGSTNAGGFFGLLQRQQQIRNQELNVRQLEAVLAQFKEFFRRDRLDAVQLKQFESSVYNQQRNLLQQKTAYENALDAFKFDLGLPPDLDVVIEDSFLDRFEFISDEINERLISIGELRGKAGEELNFITTILQESELDNREFPAKASEEIDKLTPLITEAQETLELILNEDSKQLEADFEKLASVRERRLEYLKRLIYDVQSGRIVSSIDSGLFKANSIPEAEKLREGLDGPTMEDSKQKSILDRGRGLKSRLADTKSKIETFVARTEGLDRTERLKAWDDEFKQTIPGLMTDLNNLSLEMSLLQAFARSNSIEIEDISIDDEQAIRIAKCLRRDWMNARASLVDQWRNIEFVADQLEAGVDLVLSGDIGNNGDNPFKLRYENGQIRAGFRIDAPITRLSERNQYRQALINYQQSRRQFYQFEDSIKQNLRLLIRTVGQNKVLFELDRRSVQVSIEQVESNRLELERPVGPGASSSRLGATTAQNLTQAIIGLNGTQNSFLQTWVQYEVLRRNLDFDMGTMMLDEMGQWLDPGAIDSTIGIRAVSMMGIEPDCQFCEDIGTPYLAQPTEQELMEAEEILNMKDEKSETFDILDIQRAISDENAEMDPSRLDTPESREIELRNQQLQLLQQLQEQQRIEQERIEQLRRLNQTPQPDSGSFTPNPSPMMIEQASEPIRTANQLDSRPLVPSNRIYSDDGNPVRAKVQPIERPLVIPFQAPDRTQFPESSSIDSRDVPNLAPATVAQSVTTDGIGTGSVLEASTAKNASESNVRASYSILETAAEIPMTSLPNMGPPAESAIESSPVGTAVPKARPTEIERQPAIRRTSFELSERASIRVAVPPPMSSPPAQPAAVSNVGSKDQQATSESQPAANSEGDKDAFEWKNSESSLGGLLNRFK